MSQAEGARCFALQPALCRSIRIQRLLPKLLLVLLVLPIMSTLARHNTRLPTSVVVSRDHVSAGVSAPTQETAEVLSEELTGAAEMATRPICSDFGTTGKFTGDWLDHPNPEYRGLYEQRSACPNWGLDYDCQYNPAPADTSPEFFAQEYSKVFQPHSCNLRPWDTEGFHQCMKGRRIIFVGDSMTWQQYSSLACLLSPVTDYGIGVTWDKANTTVTGEYRGREWQPWDTRTIMKQYWAHVKLRNGGELLTRCFGRYNGSLWDDVFAEIGPLTENDVIIANFGAWYPRFSYHEIRVPYEAFQADVREIFMEKLAKSPAQTIWRLNSPTHFGGHTGTYNAIEEMLHTEGVPARQQCDPVTVGEYWFRDQALAALKECGEPCKKIKLLPVFDLSLARHNSHHGSFGRGRDMGVTDCRHFCKNVVDWWNILLYSMLCF